jgi:hypothetical protein
MQALLGWYDERGVAVVDLRASAEAHSLYTSLGFRETPDPSMRRRSTQNVDRSGDHQRGGHQ